MSYELSVLVCLILIACGVVSSLFTIGFIGEGIDSVDGKTLGIGFILLILSITIWWGVWVVCPW